MRKPDFAYAKTKVQISCAVTAQLISTFVFASWIEQSIYFLNPKFQASSCAAQFVSVLVGNPEDKIFPQQGSYVHQQKIQINYIKNEMY